MVSQRWHIQNFNASVSKKKIINLFPVKYRNWKDIKDHYITNPKLMHYYFREIPENLQAMSPIADIGICFAWESGDDSAQDIGRCYLSPVF